MTPLRRSVFAAVCWFFPGVSFAQAELPDGVDIQWKTSSECTRPLDLEWQVTRLLAPNLKLTTPMSFSARVDALTGGRHALALTIRGERQLERSVDLASCAEVQDAVALLIAITLDPSAAQRAKTVRAAEPVAPPPPPAPEPPVEPAPKKPRRRLLPPPRALLRGGVLGDLHALPDASFGPTAAVELALGPLRFALGGHYLLPQRARTETPGIAARVDLGAGVLEVAYLPDLGSVALGPVVQAELGYLRAVGIGADDDRTAGTAWLAVLPGARLDVSVHPRVGVRLALLAGLPLRRPRLALRDESVFYETRSVTARIELGALFRLGSRR